MKTSHKLAMTAILTLAATATQAGGLGGALGGSLGGSMGNSMGSTSGSLGGAFAADHRFDTPSVDAQRPLTRGTDAARGDPARTRQATDAAAQKGTRVAGHAERSAADAAQSTPPASASLSSDSSSSAQTPAVKASPPSAATDIAASHDQAASVDAGKVQGGAQASDSREIGASASRQ